MQNRSSAVMQQRVEPHDSLDFFPTPPWATRALCEHVLEVMDFPTWTAWDPACGEGHMAKPLREYFTTVHTSDVHDYGIGAELRDFLFPLGDEPKVDWIVTNPPFRLAHEFIMRGLDLANMGVAVLVRVAFLEGVNRYKELFSRRPPRLIAQFCERVPMIKGRVDITATTATAYCWLVWFSRMSGDRRPDFMWIPPCRKSLERDGDYD